MPCTVIYSSIIEEWLKSCSQSLQNEVLAHVELLLPGLFEISEG